MFDIRSTAHAAKSQTSIVGGIINSYATSENADAEIESERQEELLRSLGVAEEKYRLSITLLLTILD